MNVTIHRGLLSRAEVGKLDTKLFLSFSLVFYKLGKFASLNDINCFHNIGKTSKTQRLKLPFCLIRPSSCQSRVFFMKYYLCLFKELRESHSSPSEFIDSFTESFPY